MFPPPPAARIDWTQLGLSTAIRANGHIEARYHASTGQWTAPTFHTDDRISVSGLSPGLNYGQQCYEGMKALRQQQQPHPGLSSSSPSDRIVVFRPHFHAARMARSAASVCLPPPPEALFLECVRLAVAANAELVPPAASDGFLYIRPVLFGASAQLALAPPEEVVLAVFAHPTRPYHGADALDALVLDDFDRAAPRGMGAFKVGGNYAPVWRHAARARELGYGITLHLDSAERRFVEEFSTSGFLGLRKKMSGDVAAAAAGPVLVVPQSENAIKSATSDALVRVAEREGWTVEKIALEFSELPTLAEVVAVGTAVAAVPVRSITRLSTDQKFVFGDDDVSDPTSGAEGRLVGLGRIMSQIQRGLREDTEGWCWEVTASEDEQQQQQQQQQILSLPALLTEQLWSASSLISRLHPRSLAGIWGYLVSSTPRHSATTLR